jgi:signal transduction histidine kinase
VIALLRDDPQRPLPALADLPEMVAESRAIGTPVEVDQRLADPRELPGTTGRTAYRVLQEALTNARKHAPGQPVRIALEGRPGARLLIDVSNPLATTLAAPAITGARTASSG